jgi:D-serine deaminase-like pyridoxal phosphate-dependent protein
MAARTLDDLDSPALVLDVARLRRNAARLRARLAPLGPTLRPHLKTLKSIDAARLLMDGRDGPITVSTLREAAYFAGHGVRDILYAVGIAPQKLDRVGAIRRETGADLAIILDSEAQAEAVAAWGRAHGAPPPVLIEIDPDGHRSGVRPEEAARLVAIGRTLAEAGVELRGVMAHAGESYELHDADALAAAAEQERRATLGCAEILRAAGLPCPVVSVGSTPTAFSARGLEGVTEVRAGVFSTFDLFQHGVGVCALDDIALSVLATVIGHQTARGWTITDAGWMALSRDRGTAGQPVDQGYGVVCALSGRAFPELIVARANQEHGVIALRPGATGPAPGFAVGDRLRILPNHACATAAQHDRYHVIDSDLSETAVTAEWARVNGW